MCNQLSALKYPAISITIQRCGFLWGCFVDLLLANLAQMSQVLVIRTQGDKIDNFDERNYAEAHEKAQKTTGVG